MSNDDKRIKDEELDRIYAGYIIAQSSSPARALARERERPAPEAAAAEAR